MSWFEFSLNDFSVSFLSILLEGVPFMFIGTLLSGLVDSFVSSDDLQKRLPRNHVLAIGLSGVLGVFFPMCECGIVPVIRRMIAKGYPVPAALTYLLAAPIVNPIVAISTYAAFRGQHPELVVAFRLGLGFVVAVGVGLLVSRLPLDRILNTDNLKRLPASQPSTKAHDCCHDHGDQHSHGEHDSCCHGHDHEHSGHEGEKQPSIWMKLLSSLRCASSDFLDVAFYLVIGAAVTSLFNTAVNKSLIEPLAGNSLAATPAMMLLAIVLSLCSTSDAFIAANFSLFPLASKLAFIVLGPMMDIKLLFMYGLVFKKRFTLQLLLFLFIVIGILCYAATALFGL